MSDSSPRIAMTVIGGYLGAGKTTLVNHLLRTAEERIAVLVNDFGEINVDLDLIERRTDDTIELSNGCICCSMIDGFTEALDRITAFDPRPDRLVVETSGVADPGQVGAYGHGPGLALDAVIVLADAETIRSAADDGYVGQTVRSQLAAGEIVVLNKADLVDADHLAATRGWLESGWPEAFVIDTAHSRVAPEVLFGRPSKRRFDAGSHHHPERLFETTMWSPIGPVNRSDVESLMHDLDPARTVRAKGFVHLAGEQDPYVVQRVGQRWSLRRSPGGWPSEPGTDVVIIQLVD